MTGRKLNALNSIRIGRSLLLALVVMAASFAMAPGRASAANTHPRLFVGPAVIPAADDDVRRQGREQVLRAADWALRLPIPTEPATASKHNLDRSYNPAGLVASKHFLQAGTALQHVMSVFAVASGVTKDPRYAARAVQWLDAYSRWSRFDASKPDIAGAGALVGFVVGYDFFYDQLTTVQRTRVLGTVERLTNAFTQATVKLGRLPLAESRIIIASNHNVVPACAAGLGALLLKLEGRDDGAALESVIATFRKAILPASFSAEGEYVEGTDHFFTYVMNSMTLLFEALRRNGGPNLWQEGHVRRTPEFLIRAASLNAEDTPYDYRWRHTLLAMAAVYRDPELQGLALKEGLGVGRGAKEISFPQPNAPVDAKGARPWFSSAWEYLWYDPSLPPAPLKPRPLAVMFPNLGRAIMRSSWATTASVLTFRAGPRRGKDPGDNNALQLRVFGIDILPRLEASLPPLDERGDDSYDDLHRIRGTEGNNTILVDGEGQFSPLSPNVRGRAGPQRGYTDWLAGPAGAAKAQAHLTGFLYSPVVDYVAGEAGNAYHDAGGRRTLDRFRRHVFFVKDEYVMVVDDIRTAGGPRSIEWRFHAGRHNTVSPGASTFTFRPAKSEGQASAVLRVLRPKLTASVDSLDVKRKEYRSSFVSVRTPGKQGGVLAVFGIDLQPKGGDAREMTVVRDDDRLLLVRAGTDVLVWNKADGAAEWQGLTFTGRAAWLRPDKAAVLVDGTTLEWKNARLIETPHAGSAVWAPR